MRAYFKMPIHEFVDQLRDIAIKASARPQVLAMFDALDVLPSYKDMEEAEAAAYDRGFDDGALERDNAMAQYDDMMSVLESACDSLALTESTKDVLFAALRSTKP